MRGQAEFVWRLMQGITFDEAGARFGLARIAVRHPHMHNRHFAADDRPTFPTATAAYWPASTSSRTGIEEGVRYLPRMGGHSVRGVPRHCRRWRQAVVRRRRFLPDERIDALGCLLGRDRVQHETEMAIAAMRTFGRDGGLAIRFAHRCSPEILDRQRASLLPPAARLSGCQLQCASELREVADRKGGADGEIDDRLEDFRWRILLHGP